jgi:hypothetical protein
MESLSMTLTLDQSEKKMMKKEKRMKVRGEIDGIILNISNQI